MAAFQAVSDDVFFVADGHSGDLDYASPACERVLGMTPEEVLNTPGVLSDAIFPERGGAPAAGAFETEFRFIRPDGEARWLRSRSYPVEAGAHRGQAIVGLVRDVTEQKLAARELRRSREEILELVGRIPDGILVASRERVLYVNRALATALGHDSPETVSDLPPSELVHPRDLPVAWEQLTRPLASGAATDELVELRLRAAEGEWLHFGFSPVRVVRFHGDEGILALVRNLTGEKEVEAARRRAEARYRTLYEHAPLGVALVAPDGTVLGVNPALQRLLGWADLEFGTVTGQELIHPDDQDEAFGQLNRLVAGEIDSYARETRLLRSDGGYTPVRVHASISQEEEGDAPLIITLVEDTSDRVALEQQLRTIARMESIGRLAGGIAHDFNNLVTVINGHTEMLLEETTDEDPRHEDLSDILKAGRRAAALTGQLLAFSRRTVLETRIMDLNQVLDETRSILTRTLGEDVELALQPGELQSRIQVDRSQLEQVVLNLVVNARDAMPQGGRLSIKTSETELDAEFVELHPGSQPGRYVCLEVSDTGQGMSQDLLDYIFEPFFTTKPPGSGTGLGLATVYGIVKQSMGYIQVESQVGEGTSFFIYFPARDPVEHSAGNREAPRATGGNETVLLVEDDTAVRSLAERVLVLQGYRVITAADGREGLEQAAAYEGPIHLLVTDVIMPRIGGRELAERMAEERPGTPVLFISGYTDDALLRHGVREGEVRMLYKPFTAGEFAGAVRTALDEAQEDQASGSSTD